MRILLLLPLIFISCAILHDPVVQADIQKTEQDVVKDAEAVIEDTITPPPASITSPQTLDQAQTEDDAAKAVVSTPVAAPIV